MRDYDKMTGAELAAEYEKLNINARCTPERISKGTEIMKKAKKTVLVVESGQYEMTARRVVVRHTTEAGLMRRARQLSREHAVYGDNWAGWLNAAVAIAHPDDEYVDNQIIGGQHCNPVNGWLDLEI